MIGSVIGVLVLIGAVLGGLFYTGILGGNQNDYVGGGHGEVIFTSGASEALWIALNRAKAKRRIVSAVEHDAVFRAAPDAEVFADDVPIGAGTLLAVQHVNSETGTINPVSAMAQTVQGSGALVLEFHDSGPAFDLRSVVTVLSLVTFLGIVWWAWSKRNQANFDEAAQLPFRDE